MTNTIKKIVIVLSAGRSGTSLLMKALGAMGMSLSENMIPGNYANPEGHFEDKEIVETHKSLFVDLAAHPYMPLPDGWMDKGEILRKAKTQLQNILSHKIETTPTIWGFKDPRVNAFLPLWFEIMNKERVTPIFILCVRKPDVTIASYVKQYRDPAYRAELAWLTRTTDALHHTAADCFIIHYEDWFINPIDQAKRLLTYTGLNKFFTGNVDEAMSDLVKSNLNRAVYEDYVVENEYVLKLYDALKDCKGNDFDRERLMSVVKDCRKAMLGFKGWYMEAYKYIGEQTKTLNRLDKERVRSEEMKVKLFKEQEIKVNELKQVSQAKKVLEQEKLEQVKTLQNESEELRRSLADVQDELKQVSQAKKVLEQEKLEQSQDLCEITLQNNKYLIQLKDLQDEVEELGGGLTAIQDELKQVLQAKKDEEKALQRSLTAIQNELKQVSQAKKNESEKLKNDLADVQDQLKQVSQAKKAIEREKQEQEKDLHEITLQNNEYLKQLKELKNEKNELRIRLSAKKIAPLKDTKGTINIQKLKRVEFELRNSYSYRIGQVFVNAVAKPGVNTVIAPFRLIKIVMEPVFKRK